MLRKFGRGKILRSKDEEREKKIALANFTEKDKEELEREFMEDAPRRDTDDSR